MNLPFLKRGASASKLLASLGRMPTMIVDPRAYGALGIYDEYPPAPYRHDDLNKSLGGRIGRPVAHRLWGDYMWLSDE